MMGEVPHEPPSDPLQREREIAEWGLRMLFGDAAERREALARLRELRAAMKEQQEDASTWRKPE